MNNIYQKDLGLQQYTKVFDDMLEFTSTRTPETNDEIWLVEHPAVFTQGKHGKPEHILNSHNIPIVATDRGGQVTYHGPGQAVIYFLLDIKRNKLGAKKLVTTVEQACINMLDKYYNLKAHIIDGAHGIYINNQKIASLGLRIKQGKSYHGIAINTNMDLTPFSYINPCGYSGLKMCQLANFYQEADIKKVQQQYTAEFVTLLNNSI
ncbi:lipoyl(octanoyl) transferase LipB [Francisella tularensis]|uniref:Octanoyltransferase n=4 Tax=Francisella tularensis TaxID=263 RepID=LIPB_FRATT|nr:lipoyl(octanoyl) transferase LipB [Francisella tularensis]Q14HH8.1 RecName: Full=Octanoyltransferase; AltName: Full=Lipoate-protein ligase B; AltName: Full=Lipoyl/octanoyl transferase; AltName: Full=Octanoyl-[acyl-carrier-protein]-protein N-octanoyltransferase [Francisella tularensis subsp. tularensis FSC198]Q5NG26.1 RecName: Full=Octanoyltransferase; AltName: Full=Lipoate-protein ligase B; AltName: Full=Lipoyl/octanoyl transferase; AltName: Full=Octanoyl-[acyl-carrier-protein]-protein N-octan